MMKVNKLHLCPSGAQKRGKNPDPFPYLAADIQQRVFNYNFERRSSRRVSTRVAARSRFHPIQAALQLRHAELARYRGPCEPPPTNSELRG